LVLVPTRELATQVRDELIRLGQFRRIGVVACHGGHPISRQIAALARGTHIVVGTPGRVLDHLRRGTLRLETVRTVVLDEADEMLGGIVETGFLYRRYLLGRLSSLSLSTVGLGRCPPVPEFRGC